MPIVKCECKECKFYDDKFYCTKAEIESKTCGQCVEGIKVELNKAIDEQRAYYNYNIYLGEKDI